MLYKQNLHATFLNTSRTLEQNNVDTLTPWIGDSYNEIALKSMQCESITIAHCVRKYKLQAEHRDYRSHSQGWLEIRSIQSSMEQDYLHL